MAKAKKSKKKANETLVDIVEVREQAQSFIDRNQNLVLGVLTGVVVVIGGIFAFNNFYLKPRNQEAMEMMYQAQVQFERDSFALALTSPGGGFLGFLDIADKYGRTKAGNLAHYYAGISYLNLGQYEAAIDYLKDFKPAGSILPIMKNGALGDAYSEINDFGAAMRYYQRALDEGKNEFLTPYYLKKIGMLRERDNNFKEAAKAYQRIKEEFPESTEAIDIEKYLIRAQAKAKG
jgi:tetratricopeptide (TPR) repeat protein